MKGRHVPRHGLDDGHDNGVAELLVGLRIGDGDAHGRAAGLVETHEASALARRQSARRLAFLANEDF